MVSDVRLIDANALLEEIDEEIEVCQPETTPSNKFISIGLKTARKDINRMPTINAVPVRCGRWVDYGNGVGLFCSECKHKIHYRNGIKETTVFSDGKFEFMQHPVRNGYYDFCPKCGADMRDGEVFMRGERDEDH